MNDGRAVLLAQKMEAMLEKLIADADQLHAIDLRNYELNELKNDATYAVASAKDHISELIEELKK